MAFPASAAFFFENTLGYAWDSKKIPKMKRDRQLPVILTREQVAMLIDSMENYKHKAITATMYSSGLRVSEVCHLRYEDIHRTTKMIHVPVSKNRQDRYTILSDRNLEILTEYWFRYGRPKGWLFPSTVRDEPLTTSTVEMFIKAHARSLGLPCLIISEDEGLLRNGIFDDAVVQNDPSMFFVKFANGGFSDEDRATIKEWVRALEACRN